MNDIPLADILAFGVIAACIVMSMIRGVIAEAGSLFAWVISFLLAKTFAVPFSEVAFKSIQPRALGVAISFVVIFFLARFLQQFLRTILTNAASSMGLGSVNRVLGGVFGAAKGVLLVTLAVMVCAHTNLPETEDWQSSYSIPYFQSLSEVIMPYLPGRRTRRKIRRNRKSTGFRRPRLHRRSSETGFFMS